MTSDVMSICADMVLANAIEDYAKWNNITQQEARDLFINSRAYQCLYDFETHLWADGSDYFIYFYEKLTEYENKKT